MTTIPPIRYVLYRPGHHSPHSGYSRAAQYGASQYNGQVIKANPIPTGLMPNRLLWRIANGVIAYDRGSLATEIKLVWHILKTSGYLYHILYGENLYHYSGFFNDVRNNRLVATFHQPPYRLRQLVKIDWHIRQLSAVVCVGRNQQDFFADLLPPERIFVAPLGVDTEYFTPPASFEARNSNLCLFVGNHLRDFATLRKVIDLVTSQRPETQFVALTSASRFDRLAGLSNLELLNGIPESKLLELYRSATLMVLPLQEATANNAILEAMACGLPLVVTDVGATRDYVNPQGAAFVPPGDAQAMAEEVLRLLDDPLQRQAMANHARRQALRLSWPKVIKQLQPVYEAIA